MTVQDLINAGYGGYAGWSDASANADFNATHGSGKQTNNGGSSSSSGGGGFTPLTAPDVAALRGQVYDTIHPYYIELAKQAGGDFNTAVKMMTTDYQQGVKQAKENFALQKDQGEAAFKTALGTLGVNFGNEDRQLTDDLNKRGLAVSQNNPDGTPNVVTPTTLNPTYDFGTYNTSADIPVAANDSQTGLGGATLGRLRNDQQLRAEAEMRARMQPLQQAGLTFKQYTNPATGFDINRPDLYTGDRSQLGTAETAAISRYNTANMGYRNTLQNDLPTKESSQINTITGGLASQGIKSVSSDLANQLAKDNQNTFVGGGV